MDWYSIRALVSSCSPIGCTHPFQPTLGKDGQMIFWNFHRMSCCWIFQRELSSEFSDLMRIYALWSYLSLFCSINADCTYYFVDLIGWNYNQLNQLHRFSLLYQPLTDIRSNHHQSLNLDQVWKLMQSKLSRCLLLSRPKFYLFSLIALWLSLREDPQLFELLLASLEELLRYFNDFQLLEPFQQLAMAVSLLLRLL